MATKLAPKRAPQGAVLVTEVHDTPSELRHTSLRMPEWEFPPAMTTSSTPVTTAGSTA